MGKGSWEAIGALEAGVYEVCVHDNAYAGAEFEYNFPDTEDPDNPST